LANEIFTRIRVATGERIIFASLFRAVATTIIATPTVKPESIQTAESEGRKLDGFIPFVASRSYYIIFMNIRKNVEI